MAFPEQRNQAVDHAVVRMGSARQRPLDPTIRRALYGPIRSMAEPKGNSLWQWLFGRD